MKRDELIQRAKAILAEAYEEAAYLIAEHVERNPEEKLQVLCKEIDPDNWNALRNRVQRAQDARKAAVDGGSPRAAAQNVASDRAKAKRVLRTADDEQVKQMVNQLPDDAVNRLLEGAHDVASERRRARRSEHSTEPTVGDVMRGDRFDPAEHWADTLIIRVSRNVRELAALRKRAGGLLFGTMPQEEALEYLEEAERLIADARAEMQERVREVVS